MYRYAMTILLALSAIGSPANAQDCRVVHIVVPFGAGGNVDALARNAAEVLKEKTGRVFIVENLPGANAIIGSKAVMRREARGCDIMLVATTALIIANIVDPLNAVDLKKDFVPLGKMFEDVYAFVVGTHPAVRDVYTLSDYLDAVRKKPEIGLCGTPGGTSSHALLCILLGLHTGIRIQDVSMGTLATLNVDLLGGHIPAGFSFVSLVREYRGKGLRVLMVSSENRLADLPEVPTMRELGLISPTSDFAWFIHKDTPPEIVEYYESLIESVARSKRMIDFASSVGYVPSFVHAKDFPEYFLKSEAYWSDPKLIKAIPERIRTKK